MAPIVKAPGTPPLPELTMNLVRTLRRPPLALAIALALPLSLMASASAAPAAVPRGQDLPLVPRAVLFGDPVKSGAQLSPDGRWLSWRAPVEGVLNLWVAPAGRPQ